MRERTHLIGAALCAALGLATLSANAEQNYSRIEVQTGIDGNPFSFQPDSLQFEVGKPVELVIFNPGSFKHFFASKSLVTAVQTESVQVQGLKDGADYPKPEDLGNLVIEPGKKVIWRFTPAIAGEISDWHCSAPGHEETGMVGKISIK